MSDPYSTLKLKDGRCLAWGEYGDRDGRPTFYFHGFPGCRLEAGLMAREAGERGIRIIAVDRPGYGRSDFQPNRRILDWPRDVAALGDHLALSRFSVVGYSGGGPYAAACAFSIPSRLSSATILAGMGPIGSSISGMPSWKGQLLRLAARYPRVSQLGFGGVVWMVRRLPRLFTLWLDVTMAPADKDLLADENLRGRLRQSIREALRQGRSGATWDGLLLLRPWGFSLREITIPVDLWHGEADRNVPAPIGRQVAAQLPECRARFCPDEGHLSLIYNRSPEIIRGWK